MEREAGRRLAARLAGVFLALSGGVAAAMTVTVEERDLVDKATGAPVTVYLTGLIEPDTPQKVLQVLLGLKEEWVAVLMDSPGGNLYAGMELGRVLRRYATTTTIGARGLKNKPREGGCLSACALAYLGGSYRYMVNGSIYGVHRASKPGAATAADLDMGQVISAHVGAYYREMGVDAALLDLGVKAGRDTIYVLSPKELKDLLVVNNGRKAPEWTIEVIKGGTYLKGTQETLYGTGKALFVCAGGKTSFMSFYTAGDKAQNIAKGGWFHSVMVGDNVIPLGTPARIGTDGDEIQTLFASFPRSALEQLQSAKSIGHAMQVAREAPTCVGYRVDIDQRSQERVSTYASNCLSER